MVDINPNTAELQRIINEELRLSNVFVNRLLATAEVSGWSDKQTLAQLVVILGRENNRLQDELLKAEYAKAYPEPVVLMDEAKAREVLGDAITPDGRIVLVSDWYEFNDNHKPPLIVEGQLSLEQVEAIAWWMRNKQ